MIAYRLLLAGLAAGFAMPARADSLPSKGADYAVVVSKATRDLEDWSQVVDALVQKHGAEVLVYDHEVAESLPPLTRLFPRYACFVATPGDTTRAFVANVHQLTRKLDGDPYTDVFWGILTGFDAGNALHIAKTSAPLTVRKVGSGTEIAMDMIEEGAWYCELKQNHMVEKKPGERAQAGQAPDDTTKPLVDLLNEYEADLFITSGHATERDWQIGYRYRNGSFRSQGGQLYGLDTKGNRFDIHSDNPKVYLPIGNCLMGHVKGSDSMALAWMKSAGVHQMIGYTVSTWFGYAGWGCLDYFLEQPGRYTFTEAFFANHHALIHKLGESPSRGLGFDRDVVAFYGDPAWTARMAERPKAWDQRLTNKKGTYSFEITPRRGSQTFEPINTNGSQRGHRPIVEFFPRRLGDIELVEGRDLNPVITDNFLLIPNPRSCDTNRKYRVVFKAKAL